jgi:hypothetical protein
VLRKQYKALLSSKIGQVQQQRAAKRAVQVQPLASEIGALALSSQEDMRAQKQPQPAPHASLLAPLAAVRWSTVRSSVNDVVAMFTACPKLNELKTWVQENRTIPLYGLVGVQTRTAARKTETHTRRCHLTCVGVGVFLFLFQDPWVLVPDGMPVTAAGDPRFGLMQSVAVHPSQACFDSDAAPLFRFWLHYEDIDSYSLQHWLKQRYLNYHVKSVQSIRGKQVTLRIEGMHARDLLTQQG